MTNNVSLLTNEERANLPLVLARRTKFKSMIKSSIVNYKRIFSNCLMIQGKAGTGKTTLCETFLEQLKEQNIIAGVRRVPGHVTPRSLYHVMKETSTPTRDGAPYVLLLDDVDCLADEGCLELMKAAFDTKSDTPTNRKVFYMTEDGGTGFRYNGFGIIICNNDFSNKKLSVHQEALLDRVQQLSIDLQPRDMVIYTTSLLETYLNENKDELTGDEIRNVVDLFNTTIRKWIDNDAFRKAKVNYSIRLIKKFVDAQRIYGDTWKDFNITYQKLEAASELTDIQNGNITSVEAIKQAGLGAVRVVKRGRPKSVEGEPPKNNAGKYYNPKTGKEYSIAMQYKLKKQYA